MSAVGWFSARKYVRRSTRCLCTIAGVLERVGFLCMIPTSLLCAYELSEQGLYIIRDSKLCIHKLTGI